MLSPGGGTWRALDYPNPVIFLNLRARHLIIAGICIFAKSDKSFNIIFFQNGDSVF
jgi:hypothetical protein